MGGEFRIGDAAERIDVVVRGHLHAVGPGMVADLEAIGEAVAADRVAFAGAGDRVARRVPRSSPDEHVADDVVLPLALGLVGIERVRLGAVAAVQRLVVGGRQREAARRTAVEGIGADAGEHDRATRERRATVNCFDWIRSYAMLQSKRRSRALKHYAILNVASSVLHKH